MSASGTGGRVDFRSKKISRLFLTQEMIVVVVAVMLFVTCSAVLEGFLARDNIVTLIQSVTVLGILSLGMAVAVIGRGVDFSLVSLMAVSLTLSIVLANKGYAFPEALAYGLISLFVIALITGFLIAYVEVPAIFATLAVSSIVYGFGRGIVADLDVNNIPRGLDWFNFLGRGRIFGIPVPIWTFATLTLGLHGFLTWTGVGRFIYAIGDNLLAARISGIPARPVIMLQYVLSAFLAFMAGAVTAASVGGMNMRIVNSTLIYDVLLVVVIGGIGLTGGRGGVRNVVVGTVLIGLLSNSMTLLNLSYTVQNLVKAVVLLCALVADAMLNPRDEQTSQHGDI